ncbi:MAG: DUF1566 domain-containing protein [Clostridium sp.]|nr:DUF1566 domain-containing protein [Clostridium sp.]
MNKLRLLFALTALWATLATLQAQTRHMVVYRTDGTRVAVDIATIDSIRVEELPYGGHDYVDLGLSVMWAANNVGAATPAQSGHFYAWGETGPKDDYSEERYLYYVNEQYTHIGTDIAATRYDAAQAVMGNGWRMPTLAEAEELVTQCEWTPDTLDGVAGYRVTGPVGTSIFLPAAGCCRGTKPEDTGIKGYYWTSTRSATLQSAAHNINFAGYAGQWTASRSYGFSVRAVHAR